MNTKWILGIAAVAATSIVAGQARAEEVVIREQPSIYVGPNRELLGTGLITIAASYTPAVVAAATSPRKEDQWLYIPVAGPWMDLATRSSCEASGISCSREDAYRGLLVVAGIAHAVGVGLVVASFIAPERSTVATVTTGRVQLTPAQLGRDGYGLVAFGSF